MFLQVRSIRGTPKPPLSPRRSGRHWPRSYRQSIAPIWPLLPRIVAISQIGRISYSYSSFQTTRHLRPFTVSLLSRFLFKEVSNLNRLNVGVLPALRPLNHIELHSLTSLRLWFCAVDFLINVSPVVWPKTEDSFRTHRTYPNIPAMVPFEANVGHAEAGPA